MLKVFKWLFIPYLLCVLFAAIIGKEIVGNSLLEEYLTLMAFIIIIDMQRIGIDVFQKIQFKD